MKEIVYLSLTPPELVGVRKKIANQVSCCERIGVHARWLNFSKGNLPAFIQIYRALLVKRFDVLILRQFGARMVFVVPLLMALRVLRTEVIIDMPTPCTVVLREIWTSNSSIFVRYLKPLALFFVVPVTNLLASTVCHYSEESKWFSIFASRKTRLVTNGYDFDAMDERPSVPVFMNELRIICVASIAYWHGYDRLINGVHCYTRARNSKIHVKVTIVGDGPHKQTLVDLVQKLSLNNVVAFVGSKSGYELQKLYNSHHIGVSSLGSFRKKLYLSSDLKNREYACVGLPFIIATADPDFPFNLPYVFQVPQDESFVDIDSVIRFYTNLASDSLNHLIRSEAENRISYETKIRDLLNLQ